MQIVRGIIWLPVHESVQELTYKPKINSYGSLCGENLQLWYVIT